MSFYTEKVAFKCPVPFELYSKILWSTDLETMTQGDDEYAWNKAYINSVNSSGSKKMPLLQMVYCNAFNAMKYGDVERMRENFARLKDDANDVIMSAMEGNNVIGNFNEESLRKFSDGVMKLTKTIENMIKYAELCIDISEKVLPMWLAMKEQEDKDKTKPKKKTRRGGKKHKKNK